MQACSYLECPSIIWEVFAKKSADIHESSQLIHYYLYTISILCSPFYLLRALYPNRTSVESRLDSAHKPWYTVLCSGAKFISSLSDFSKKGTITDGDLYFGPLEGTPWLFHKKRLQFHNVPISEFQNQLQTNLTK